MARLTALNVAVDVPSGWDARLYRRPATGPTTTHAALHVATFPLPVERGDFGSGAVEIMGPDDVLVVLLEYHPSSTSTALFAAGGVPGALAPEDFSPAGLQRRIEGQAGTQQFFSVAGRAWTLYVVLGSWAARSRLVPLANQVVGTIDIGALGS